MNGAERLEASPEGESPGGRLSRMSRASIRITETLDLNAVLQGVVDGACLLTGARRGGITVLDDGGGAPVFVTSGLTAEEHRLLFELPGGPKFFEHLSGLADPLRVGDFSGYIRGLGLPEVGPPLGPVGAFLGSPIRYLGRRVGNLYLSDKEGDAEFTPEDEGMLALFASQAALAIANARRYREEQRAKADLETLVNTSPVGVVVFAAGTGELLSINREALRIVDGLRSPDQSPEQLLEVLTFRRADGREVSLRQYPLARVLSSGETVRAEEIVLQVPDGRRVNTIINVTPILGDDGGVASVVVTLQDLAPIKELGRQRAEFLSMVSQELLAPLTSIKGSAAAVLEDLGRLDIAKARQFFSIIEWQADRMRGLIWDLVELARIEAGTLLLTPEPTDLAFLVGQAQASFLEGGAATPVEMDLPPDLPRVSADRQRTLWVLDRLMSHAAGYSPEGSVVTVTARGEDSHVAVCVADRGRDIPSEPFPLLFRRLSPPGGGGGSVAGGQALSLAVCRGTVEAHGGRLWIENDGPGLPSRCIFTLPVVDDAAPRRAGGSVLPQRPGCRPWSRTRAGSQRGPPGSVAHTQNPDRSGLHPPSHLGSGRSRTTHRQGTAPPGARGLGTDRRRRIGADPAHIEGNRRAGRDTVGAQHQPPAGPCPSIQQRRRRLHNRTLLTHRTGSPGRRGAATTRRPAKKTRTGILPTRGTSHRLQPAPGHDKQPGRDVDRHGIPPALRASRQRRTDTKPGTSDEPGLVSAGTRKLRCRTSLHQTPTPQTRRNRRQPHLRLQRTPPRLPARTPRRAG